MTKKLETDASIEILRKALGSVRPSGDLKPDETLGQLMPRAEERSEFRGIVQELLKEENFHIESAAIPIFSHTRLDEITEALTLSALPGNPTTEKPDYDDTDSAGLSGDPTIEKPDDDDSSISRMTGESYTQKTETEGEK
jgi:hypothetical protein